ncbi:putative deoxyribonuclease ii [Operophtera brumata]|uniref:Putative deoxyribonuclease ii n=1 Tax=Operophtera brumata TaxID=104452 RepID=A0A0L7K4F5_OPEBR|nr:putative deoxyribonuclease ii [Operophtera brumata]
MKQRSSATKYKRFKLGDKYYDDYDLAEMFSVHSLNGSSYDYPQTGMKYGQTFLCVSVQTATLNQIAIQLQYNEPLIVYANIPQEFVSELPHLMDVVGNKTIDVSPWSRLTLSVSVHSLNGSSYDYPQTGMKYGQTFLCVSVQTATLNQIAIQLQYNEPLIVYANIPQEFVSELPHLMDVVGNKTIDVSPWYHIESFETLVGRKFLSFAKSAMFNDDLYSGLVAEVLQSDLLVESWTNGPGTLDSECGRNFQ